MRSDHRPWKAPLSPWRMKQVWEDLLFTHWPVPVSVLRPLVPKQLEIDTYQGQTWIGVVPFHMSGIRMHYLPEIPFTSRFAEINVRVYVALDGKPGVYFFSLDAANYLAVKVARAFYHLPYYYAKFNILSDKNRIHYDSSRYPLSDRFRFLGEYGPESDVYRAEKGSLEYWLTERYCLYSNRKDRIYRCEILHEPWPLQKASAEIRTNTMVDLPGFRLPDTSPLLHFSKRIEVLTWGLERVR
ncbi:DUF2071 domain-containing protein [Leptospira wolffii]|nr:DUF2071 domain-containing protein [Leptospira wolffii]TGK68119.1 DUF2071 domain-containing protein [Leptospira wolffii]TGK74252.1 DUF2071 domain-containing protein [Leptospira wolffii]TGL32173.1 DUF2071 domain-containing protein [Leptospira wolffii]